MNLLVQPIPSGTNQYVVGKPELNPDVLCNAILPFYWMEISREYKFLISNKVVWQIELQSPLFS